MIGKLSIQSKLMLMLLSVCISSIMAIAYVGYNNGRQALSNSIQNQLVSLREAKARDIENYFGRVRSQVQSISEVGSVVNAVKELKVAYQELEEQSLPIAWNDELKNFYNKKFLPRLEQNTEGNPLLYSYFPQTTAARHLQYNYIAANSNSIGEREFLNKANDGSKYSQIHSRIQPIYRNFVERFFYYDLFLIDAETGDILYTVEKETDFGTNVFTGPYASSSLAEVVKKASRGRNKDFVAISDFEPYSASYGIPAAFIASPIFDNSELIGILAFQISIDEINYIMTSDRNWSQNGLGKTGETYLVGPGYGMRSTSRFFIEEPEAYFKAIKAEGLAKDKIESIKKLNTTILNQEVNTPAVDNAFNNQTGYAIVEDYRGEQTLSAYRPLELDNLDWVINAQIDTAEAFSPIRAFQRRVLLATAIIVLFVTLIASILSYYFVKPIRALIDGFRRVGKGDTEVKVKVKSKDEFRELANSFNEMVDNLDHQKKLVQQKNEENEELLLSILPESVAKRVQQGESEISDSFSNVTVLFADLGGFSELSETLSANETVGFLNDLILAFDDAAEKHGVEKHKTIGSGYMAVCGLSVPRLDQAKRIIDFAKDMLRIVRRFNREKNIDLKLRIGINSGSVVAGIVGKDRFIYDLWGDTVNIASRLQSQGEWNTIQITQNVYNRISEFVEDFHSISDLELSTTEKLGVWANQPYETTKV
ncbi:MAG: adenylate/guanylate cyclase domain-containing protein [Cyanobacteria bacterium J06623_7]